MLALFRRGCVLRGSQFAVSRHVVSYVQGQSPSPKVREYFYYIDHQGQLFLDDTKVKNFITCFKGYYGEIPCFIVNLVEIPVLCELHCVLHSMLIILLLIPVSL